MNRLDSIEGLFAQFLVALGSGLMFLCRTIILAVGWLLSLVMKALRALFGG